MTRLSPTEGDHPQRADLDLLSTPQLVALLANDQRTAADAVLAQSAEIAAAVDEIARRLAAGGRLHYVGAGTSGRLATLDAAEMPPTFGTDPELVRAHVAGGSAALVAAVEGAEDDEDAGRAVMRQAVKPGDAVAGISASGTAPFVLGALDTAAGIGAYTLAITSDAESPLAQVAALAIALPTGAEVLAGSTRLKAGTAQKIALNTISTAVMVRLNKAYGNLMVDVVATNRKLRARSLRLICRLAEVSEDEAPELLERANGRVKVAVVMARHNLDAAQAQALLDRHDGALRDALC